MSIYATLWRLQFPSKGDDFLGCDWVEVMAQGVPAHIGTPSPGHGYEEGDPYAEFLPPAVSAEQSFLRAVVIVRAGTPKGTERHNQEYTSTLLVLPGEEYAKISFEVLHERICAALRGNRPRVVAQIFTPEGEMDLLHEKDQLEH